MARHPGGAGAGGRQRGRGRTAHPAQGRDRKEARACLALLSGRRHRVLGGLAVGAPDNKVRTRLVETAVRFKRLEAAEIDAYIQSGEWRGKAGGYAIQGRAATFVSFLSGSYTNVVGLPLFETVALLKSMAAPVSRHRPPDLPRPAQGVPDGPGRRRPAGRAAGRAPRQALAGREPVPRTARAGDARARRRLHRHRARALGLPARRGPHRRLAAARRAGAGADALRRRGRQGPAPVDERRGVRPLPRLSSAGRGRELLAPHRGRVRARSARRPRREPARRRHRAAHRGGRRGARRAAGRRRADHGALGEDPPPCARRPAAGRSDGADAGGARPDRPRAARPWRGAGRGDPRRPHHGARPAGRDGPPAREDPRALAFRPDSRLRHRRRGGPDRHRARRRASRWRAASRCCSSRARR